MAKSWPGDPVAKYIVAPVEEVLAFLVERIDDLELQTESLRRVITLLHPQEDVDRAVRRSSYQMSREALQQQENETNKKQTGNKQ